MSQPATQRIFPFVEQGHFTSVHNAVFDVMMPELPPNAFKVLCFVIRKTVGWVDKETGQRKESDQLSYSQIMAGTGIKSTATVATALKVLVTEYRYLTASSSDELWEANTYGLNRALEIEVPVTLKIKAGSTLKIEAEEAEPALKIEADATLKIKAGSTLKIKDTKERTNKKKEIDPPPPQTQLQATGGGENQKIRQSSKGIPAHVKYLSDKNMGAAHLFADCDPDATIAMFDLMTAAGWSTPAIVNDWKLNPPTSERVIKFEEQRHAANNPQRLQPDQKRKPREGSREYYADEIERTRERRKQRAAELRADKLANPARYEIPEGW